MPGPDGLPGAPPPGLPPAARRADPDPYMRRPRIPGMKVYCDRCGSLFGSRAEFDRHVPGHSGAAEACPIDVALSRLAGAIRRLAGQA